jgi:hypothetical protein
MPLWILGLLLFFAALRPKDRAPAKRATKARPPSRVRHWLWTLATLILVAVLVWLPDDKNGNLPSQEFYLAVAQLIPVLMLAVGLEGRAVHVLDRQPAAYRWQILAALAISEVAALVSASAVLAAPQDYLAVHPDIAKNFLPGPNKKWSDLLSWLTIVGLAAGFLAVVVVALRPTQDSSSQ